MEKLKVLWSQMAPFMKRLGRGLALYIDDLLLLAAGACFVSAARDLAGGPGALIVAGICLTGYALVIARSRRGGGDR